MRNLKWCALQVPNMHIFAVEAFTAIPEDGLPRHDGFP
jgi:hypothetical protein